MSSPTRTRMVDRRRNASPSLPSLLPLPHESVLPGIDSASRNVVIPGPDVVVRRGRIIRRFPAPQVRINSYYRELNRRKELFNQHKRKAMFKLAYEHPLRVLECLRRNARREVLFAKLLAGYKGSGPGRRRPDGKYYRRREESNYRC